VLIQAGSSGRGREFASRWADLIFTGDPGIEVARNHYADQKERIDAAGTAVVIICNKWDLVDAEDREKVRRQVADMLGFLSYAPMIPISAVGGREQLLGHPAIRIITSMSPSPAASSSAR